LRKKKTVTRIQPDRRLF